MARSSSFCFDMSQASEEADDGRLRSGVVNGVSDIEDRPNEETVLLVLGHDGEDAGDPNVREPPNPFNGVVGASLALFKAESASLVGCSCLNQLLAIFLPCGILSRCHLLQSIQLASSNSRGSSKLSPGSLDRMILSRPAAAVESSREIIHWPHLPPSFFSPIQVKPAARGSRSLRSLGSEFCTRLRTTFPRSRAAWRSRS